MKVALALLISALVNSLVVAQERQWQGAPSDHLRPSPLNRYGPGFGPSWPGASLCRLGIAWCPLFTLPQVPNVASMLFVFDPFLFGTSPLHGGQAGSHPGKHYPSSWFFPRSWIPSENSSSWHFVEKWSNRSPILETFSSDFGESILLLQDMAEEDVIQALESPYQRIRSEKREFWKYSNYSLLFYSGKLLGIY